MNTPTLYVEVLRSDWDATQATIEQQAREIERLQAQAGSGTRSNKYRAELYDEVWESARSMGFSNVTEALRELASLRAKQPGVVLPERHADGQVNIDSTLFNEIRISEPVNEEGEPTKYIITEQQLQRIADLEFARLNSSPVSAGYADDQAYEIEAERLTAEALGTGAGINPDATSVDDIFLDAGAGGMDERALLREALELWLADYEEVASNPDFEPHPHVADRIAKTRAALTASAQSVPDGYVLVPQRMELMPADIASIMFHCGGDQDATEVDEMFVGGVLWVGDIKDDDDKLVHGLHIATTDYPEEGSTTLVEFAAAPAPGKGGGSV